MVSLGFRVCHPNFEPFFLTKKLPEVGDIWIGNTQMGTGNLLEISLSECGDGFSRLIGSSWSKLQFSCDPDCI